MSPLGWFPGPQAGISPGRRCSPTTSGPAGWTICWRLNGTECLDLAGCLDLDLNFSPSTNLLPIRRLGLAVGQAAEVRAAWLRFPSFTLEPLEQRYRRLAAATYRYESAGGRFVTDLQVNAAGFVTHYPSFWQVEPADSPDAESPATSGR